MTAARPATLINKLLGLWDGEALASLPGPYAENQRARLEEWRLQLARDPAGPGPGGRLPRGGRLRTDRAHRRAPAARAAARAAHGRPVPQRPAGRGPRRVRRHPPPARRGAGRRPAPRTRRSSSSGSCGPTRSWPARPTSRPRPPRRVRPAQLPATVPDFTGRASVRTRAGRPARDRRGHRHGGLRAGRHRRRGQDDPRRARRAPGARRTSRTASCTSTSRARARRAAEPETVLGSFLRALGTRTPRSRTRWRSGPRSTAPPSTAAASWSCSTTPATRPRSGPCCPARRAAPPWSPAGPAWSTSPAPTSWTWT